MALLTRQNRRMDTIGLSKQKTQTIMNSKHQSEILCLWNEPTESSTVRFLSLDTFRICCANCWHGLLTGGRWWGHPYLHVKKYLISFNTHQARSTRYGFLRAVTCSAAVYTEPQFPVYRKGKWRHCARFNFFMVFVAINDWPSIYHKPNDT